MKTLVERARHWSVTLADAVRRAVDPPLAADARPIDVLRTIVEAVEREVEPAGGGRHVLPAAGVHVRVLAGDLPRRRALEAVLDDLRGALTVRLRELRCDLPARFAVEVTYVRRPPAEWEAGQRVAVRFAAPATAEPSPTPGRAQPLPMLSMTVVRGEAEKPGYAFREVVVRLGRSADPTDERGRPRFNHVAFLENGRPENRTVTRGHAVIRFQADTREYRLFDEGSANGTRVLRNGEAIDLPRRDPVGFALRSGDEVQLGQAALRLRIDEAAPPG